MVLMRGTRVTPAEMLCRRPQTVSRIYHYAVADRDSGAYTDSAVVSSCISRADSYASVEGGDGVTVGTCWPVTAYVQIPIISAC